MINAKEKSFEYANDAMKLILTLSTGVLAFSLTFLKDVIGSKAINDKYLLEYSWFVLLFATFMSIWSLFAIAGSLNAIENCATTADQKKIHIYNPNIAFPAGIAIISFIAGVLLYVNFALSNF